MAARQIKDMDDRAGDVIKIAKSPALQWILCTGLALVRGLLRLCVLWPDRAVTLLQTPLQITAEVTQSGNTDDVCESGHA